MKYIVIVLVIITILHDISIWRLDYKFNKYQEWTDIVLHRLKEMAGEADRKE